MHLQTHTHSNRHRNLLFLPLFISEQLFLFLIHKSVLFLILALMSFYRNRRRTCFVWSTSTTAWEENETFFNQEGYIQLHTLYLWFHVYSLLLNLLAVKPERSATVIRHQRFKWITPYTISHLASCTCVFCRFLSRRALWWRSLGKAGSPDTSSWYFVMHFSTCSALNCIKCALEV